MSWDAIGAIAELLDAIAVIVTIGYLATQLRQSSKISRTDALDDIQGRFNVRNGLLVEVSELRSFLTTMGDI